MHRLNFSYIHIVAHGTGISNMKSEQYLAYALINQKFETNIILMCARLL